MQWPPTPGSRREPHEPERLRGGRVDDLPHVEAHPLAQQGKLVHECDVHVAEHVLEQLGQLRGVGRRQLDDPRVDPAEERGGSACRVGGRRTDEPRDVLRCAGRVTGTDALRREREIEIDAGAETAALEGLAERAGRRPGERRRLEDDELARTQPAAQVVRGAEDRAEVRILGRRDRGRDAHEHRVDRGDIGVLGRHDPEPALQATPESLVVDIVDRGPTGPELLDARGACIEPDDVEARFAEREGQRQPDIAEADDRDPRVGRGRCVSDRRCLGRCGGHGRHRRTGSVDAS